MLKIFLASVLFLGTHVSVCEAAPLNSDVASCLARIRGEDSGARITEELLRKGDKPGTAIQRKIRQAAAAAIPYLDESVRKAPWNESHMGIDGPACFDAAPKFALMLRGMGLPGYVAACAHHVFMIVETAEATLLVDPTIRQYFGQTSAPAWVPKIFVGTLSELKALFARDPGLPVLSYQSIYFNPDWPATRRESKMLSRRDKFLRSSGNAEHAPLTTYFNAGTGSFRCQN
jgi:hypothetical protein